MLDHLLTTLPLLLTGLFLGGMMFFAFVFAPLVFARLPAETAGGFIRQVFPVYYRVFAAVCLLAALAAWGSLPAGARLDASVLALVAAGFLFAWLWLMPRINRARDAGAADAASATRFARLHRLSVVINTAQLVAVLIVFVRLAG